MLNKIFVKLFLGNKEPLIWISHFACIQEILFMFLVDNQSAQISTWSMKVLPMMGMQSV